MAAASLASTGGAAPPPRVAAAGPTATPVPSTGALLGLYSLEARLARARAELSDATARVDALAARQRSTRAQLRFAEQTLERSQALLGERLRDLYVAGEPDPLAIVLGATSLDEAMAGIEDLHRAASQNESTIVQTRKARRSLRHLTAQLEVREARLRDVRAAAAASAASLESTLRERRAYLARVQARERLKTAQVSALERQARGVESRAEELTATSSSALTPAQAAAVVSTSPSGWGERTLTVSATGYSIHGRTATGAPTGVGIVAVDPAVIPLGTRMTIPGYGEGVAADTGGAIQGATIDVWFATVAEARAWGRRTVTITLH